jgi:hypothetical protein
MGSKIVSDVNQFVNLDQQIVTVRRSSDMDEVMLTYADDAERSAHR